MHFIDWLASLASLLVSGLLGSISALFELHFVHKAAETLLPQRKTEAQYATNITTISVVSSTVNHIVPYAKGALLFIFLKSLATLVLCLTLTFVQVKKGRQENCATFISFFK